MNMPDKQLIFTHNYLKESLLHKAFINGDNYSYTSLYKELNKNINEQDEIVVLLNFSHLLQSKANEFSIYKDLLTNISFLKEVLDFSKECILFNIEDIPIDEYHPQELLNILNYAKELNLKEYEIVYNLNNIKNNLSAKNPTFAPSFEKDYFNYCLKKDLQQYQASPKEINRSIHRAINIHKELEGAISDALKHFKDNKSCSFILCEPDNQYEPLTTILASYNIPYSYTNRKYNPRIPIIFTALCHFLLDPNEETLLDCLKLNAFNIPLDPKTLIELENKLIGIDLIRINNNEKLVLLQNIIDSLIQDKTHNVLEKAYTIISSSPLIKDEMELKSGNEIGKIIIDSANIINDENDINMIINYIEHLQITTSSFSNEKCIITDLWHPILNSDYVYILGATNKNYPGFEVKNGIFDEQFVSDINYPTLSKRNEAYMDELSWINNVANIEIKYSYYTNSYDKHSQELAYDIAILFDDIKEKDIPQWELPLNNDKTYPIHKLINNQAFQLFTKEIDDSWFIPASISSIETWFRCPYQYFLNKGLRLGSAPDDLLAANIIGSLMHKCLENYDKGRVIDNKPIKELLKDNIQLINDEMAELKKEWPHDEVLIDLTKERLIRAISKAISFLDKYNQMPSYTVFNNETKEYQEGNNYTFGSEYTIDEIKNKTHIMNEHLSFRGSIDRLNQHPITQQLSIIDYKSSAKTLSKQKIESGLQLQLLTYLIISILTLNKDKIKNKSKEKQINDLLDKYGLAVFYYSLKEDNIPIKAYRTISKQNELNNPLAKDFKDNATKKVEDNHKLKGKSFVTRDNNENIANTIATNSSVFSNPLSDYYKLMKKIYAFFVEDLLSENPSLGINTMPNEDLTCAYCDYHRICRYHGDNIKREAICSIESINEANND